jgi:hypothetical protein
VRRAIPSGDKVRMSKMLVIVPCGQGKFWDDDPQQGPTQAREVYTEAPLKVNRLSWRSSQCPVGGKGGHTGRKSE